MNPLSKEALETADRIGQLIQGVPGRTYEENYRLIAKDVDYCITQLTEENRQLQRSVDELRAQVGTARLELAREAGTIAKLAKDKRELVSALRNLEHRAAAALNGVEQLNPATVLASCETTLSRLLE